VEREDGRVLVRDGRTVVAEGCRAEVDVAPLITVTLEEAATSGGNLDHLAGSQA
jgi:hypothetical protein